MYIIEYTWLFLRLFDILERCYQTAEYISAAVISSDCRRYVRTYSATLKFCVISLSQTWYKDDRVRFVPVLSQHNILARVVSVLSHVLYVREFTTTEFFSAAKLLSANITFLAGILKNLQITSMTTNFSVSAKFKCKIFSWSYTYQELCGIKHCKIL